MPNVKWAGSSVRQACGWESRARDSGEAPGRQQVPAEVLVGPITAEPVEQFLLVAELLHSGTLRMRVRRRCQMSST